jgi:hypothetical protein
MILSYVICPSFCPREDIFVGAASNVNSFSYGREASMQYKLAWPVRVFRRIIQDWTFSLINFRLLVLCVMHSSNISIHR